MRSQRSSSLRCKDLRVIEFANSGAALLAHHFHDHSLVSLAIKFGVENSLPGAEIQSAGGGRDDHFMVNEQRFQMRVAVVFTGAVMLVAFAKGSELRQPLVNIFGESRFVV